MWVGDANGLYHIPEQNLKEGPITIHFYPLNPERLISLNIRDIEITDDRSVWVGTNSGLFIFDREDQTFSRVYSGDSEIEAMLSSQVWQLMRDQQNNLWISTLEGLAIWRAGADAPESVNRFSNSDLNLAGEMIQSVFEDEDGLIYVGTGLNGALILDTKTMEITHYQHRTDGSDFLMENDVHFFMKDADTNYWFGYHYSGLSIMHKEVWDYTFGLADDSQGRSERINQIRSIYLDSNENFWFSTGEGIFFRSADGSDRRLFVPSRYTISGERRDLETYQFLEIDGFIYTSTATELLRFDLSDPVMEPIDLTIETREIGLLFHQEGFIYTSAADHGMVIINLDDNNVSVIPNIQNEPELPAKEIFQPFIDAAGTIWVAELDFSLPFSWTTYRYDPVTQTFDPTLINSPVFSSFTSRPTVSFTEPGVVWAITDRGLLRENYLTGEFQFFLQDSPSIIGSQSFMVQTDIEGYVWIGGMQYLMRFDPVTGNLITLQPEAARRPLFMLLYPPFHDGRMAAVGNGGYILFNPMELTEEKPGSFMHITEIRSGSDTINLLYTPVSPLSFDSRSRNHTVSFIGLNYKSPASIRYRYRLLGQQDEWIEVGMQNQVYLANLRPGSYTFEVQARSSSGSFGDNTASLSFTIRPPWWQTIPAYIFFALLIAGGVVATDRVQRRRVIRRERERAREKELEQAREIEKAYHRLELAHENLKSAQQQLVQQEKLASLGQLTAGIAHEIKNPLNFVNNFSEITIELVDEIRTELESLENRNNGSAGNHIENLSAILTDVRSNLQKIYEHGSRADGIVRSMLLHSRGGSGRMEPSNLNAVVKEYVNLAYHGMRAAKEPISVQIELDLDESIGLVPMIAEDFSRVILNLCNNAFDAMREKLSQPEAQPYKAKLTVRTKTGADGILVEVSDNGPGIPAELRDKIMQPFFTTKKGTLGTGLGLSITHDIVKAHGGILNVASEPGTSTTFTITLPQHEEANV